MSTIRVRRLDDNYDTVFGQGKSDYIEDIDAVVQILRSRLLLFKGEWWEDQAIGLPLWQSILGTGRGNGSGKKAVDNLIQQQIVGTPYVTGIENLTSSYDPETRAYIFSAIVNTQFGTIGISNQS